MRSERISWWAHWASLAENFLPRRYKWFVTPNQYNRGSQINQNIVDETGVLAARTLAAGLVTGLTSPTRPWFKLGIHGMDDLSEDSEARVWLDEVEKRLLRIFAGSNFYQSIGTLYHDNVIFGSANMIIYEDAEQVIRCFNPCLGEFFFGSNAKLQVDKNYREFTYTVAQTVDQFGLENCSDSVQQSWKNGGASRVQEVVICHAIEPNTQLYIDGAPQRYAVPLKFSWRECYWEQGGNADRLLEVKGYVEKPFIGLRWDVVSNDSYGRSPGMDALPAVRQMQIEQRRKAEAIDKLVRPPMVGSVSMKNEPASILPGAITYVADVAGSGFKPAYQVDPRLAEMMEDIKEVGARVNSIFYVDLFMMISQLDTVRTATEIDARREEKLVLLGPVIERTENEGLDVIITRAFSIALRRGLLPPPPESVAGQEISIQYISMLAEAQRVASTAAIERLFNMVGYAAGVQPAVLDTINFDEAIDQYADALGTSPKIMNSPKAIAMLRQQRAQQQQQAQAAQMGLAATEAAKNLSATDVGGGQNAISAMLYGPKAAA